MKDIKRTVSTFLCASLLLGLCSCTDKAEETTKERATTTTTTEETTTTTEESTSEETTTSETTTVETTDAQSEPIDEDAAYQEFVDGLAEAIRNGEPYYYGPDHTDDDVGELGIAAYYLSWSDSFYYTLADIDGDGRNELIIGHEDYGQSGDPIIRVDGLVTADEGGRCSVLLISWERSMTEYLGNGYFLSGGSGGATHGVSQIDHFEDGALVTIATLYTDYEETDDGYEMQYTLYLDGIEDDDHMIIGDLADSSWNELLDEAESNDNELVGAEWTEVAIGE